MLLSRWQRCRISSSRDRKGDDVGNIEKLKINFDVDIDFGNRADALQHLQHIGASMKRDESFARHASGVYFTDIPHDVNNQATIDYKEAEDRGYFKVDFLNVSIYEKVKSEQHLITLMTTEPDWNKLLDKDFCSQLIHIGNWADTIKTLKEPINSIPRLAMFLATIRPGKKHLLGQAWKEVAKTVWDRDVEGYTFRKSHAIAYSHLVVVHINLLVEEGK
jgi:hypothetical protein